MKFERKIHPQSGYTAVFLNLEGLDISHELNLVPQDFSVTETCEEDGLSNTLPVTTAEHLDIIEQCCYFRISTYDILKQRSGASDCFEDVFRPVHLFFDTCTDAEKKLIGAMYVRMHYLILDKIRTAQDLTDMLTTVTNDLGLQLMVLDQQIDICGRIQAIVEQHVPIPSFDNAGGRPQDTAEMTFVKEDVVELVAIVVLCKMMTPIFGVYIERCKKKMDNSLKELHCVCIMHQILMNRYKRVILKLTNFLNGLIKPMIQDTIAYVFNGYTLPVLCQHIYAAILTRRFVNVNLFQEDCNLMTYITVCARSAVRTAGSTASNHKKNSVKEIKKPKELYDDDGNTSVLEIESRQSCRTADQIAIVELAVEETIRHWLLENDVPYAVFEEAVEYYTDASPVSVTPINTYLIASLFGRRLCGAASVEIMSITANIKMIVLLQLALMQYGYPELVHLCSVSKMLMGKAILTRTDNLIKATWDNTFEYRNLTLRFPWSIIDISWDTKLKDIVDYLITNRFVQNTAPVLCERMGQTDDGNGTPFEYQDNVIKQICAVLEMITTPFWEQTDGNYSR